MTATAAASEKSFATFDGMSNVLSRLENAAGVSRLGESSGVLRLTGQQVFLNDMYRRNWLARRIVDCVADDMGRDGIELTVPENQDAVKAFEDAEQTTGLWDDITDGIRRGRLYGGGLAVIIIDGQDPSTPLDVATIGVGQYKGLMVFDRWEVTPSSDAIAELGRDFGHPVFYTVNETNVRFHHSRVIRFFGAPLPKREARQEQFWSASILEKVADEIARVKTGDAGVANLLRFAHLRIFSIEDYREMIASGGDTESRVIKHFSAIAKMQDILGATVLDGKDKFQTTTYSFAGLRDVQEGQMERVAGATEIPLIKLTGRSPGGLNANATSEGAERSYYEKIMRDVERDLRPSLNRIIPVIFQSALGHVPEGWSFQFRPLYQLRDSEKAAVLKDEIAPVVELHGAGLLDTPAALEEIRGIGKKYGRFACLTPEKIKEIVNEPPPAESLGLEGLFDGEKAK